MLLTNRHRVGYAQGRDSRRQRVPSEDCQERCHEDDEGSEEFETKTDPSRCSQGTVLTPVVRVDLIVRYPNKAVLVAIAPDRGAAAQRLRKVNENRRMSR